MPKLSTDYRRCLRLFTYYYYNNTLNFFLKKDFLGDIDYLELMCEEPSWMESLYAVFSNNIEMDENGKVLNFNHCLNRSAQYIKMCCDEEFVVEPEFEEWELELY